MSNTLTPTEQQAVKVAAESNCVCPENDCVHKTSFNRGVSFALSTLFEPRCVAFAEWCAWNYEQSLTGNKWLKRGANPVKYYTTKELYSIYNEQLNKQQDEKNKT